MKTIALSLGYVLCGFGLVASEADRIVVNIASDRPDCFYRTGEKCVFEVTGLVDTNGTRAAAGSFRYVIDDCWTNEFAGGTVDFAAANPVKIEYRIPGIGFYRLRVLDACKFDRFGKAVRRARDWTVVCEPEKIRKGSDSPADFDGFWAGAVAKCAEVPLDAEVERVDSMSNAKWDVFTVSFATLGENRRVYGLLSVPKGAPGRKYPLQVEVPGAGFAEFSQCIWPKEDRIILKMGVFPWTPGRGVNKLDMKVNYDNLLAACRAYYGGKVTSVDYPIWHLDETREKYFFYPVVLGINRAIDWAVAREDVDRSKVWYAGTSQGGYFGIMLTALNRSFTRAVFFVPAGTDMHGFRKGRVSGWPRPYESFAFDAARQERAVANSVYFDAANFASRIRCACRFIVGLADVSCPPPCVYAAFNEVRVADRAIIPCPGMTHSVDAAVEKRFMDWLGGTSGFEAQRAWNR